jgi:phage terminase Nu1 subunit (DNA packaging protein)
MASQIEVAAHLDLSDRQIRNLLADGVLPASKGRGGMDVDACRMAYIAYLRGLGSGQVKLEAGPPEVDGFDPLLEYKLMEERRGLTAAQRIAAEKKNEVAEKNLVPVEFCTFALARVAAQIGSVLDTVALKVKRKHPDIEVHHVEAMQREVALARNISADLGEQLPEILDEYLASLDE